MMHLFLIFSLPVFTALFLKYFHLHFSYPTHPYFLSSSIFPSSPEMNSFTRFSSPVYFLQTTSPGPSNVGMPKNDFDFFLELDILRVFHIRN